MRVVTRVFVASSTRGIAISAHAAKRWHQRCRPDAGSLYAAMRELETEVARQGSIRATRPPGIHSSGLKHELLTDGWLTLERDHRGRPAIVFPLTDLGGELVATTCIARRMA